jgi:hypothetical protein
LALAILVATVTPARAQGASRPSTSLSGYMEFHFNKEGRQDPQFDFHRFVLLTTHQFTDRIRFVGELELEHALVEGLEEGGELELEQAYVDFLLSRRFNVRAGMLLMPIGIINERHEPPVFYGVERPLTDTVIIPSTWFDTGVGIHGELGRGWRYRFFATSPLNARFFSADEGIREGRQQGNQANVRSLASTGRLEYVGIRGLTAGSSFWHGESGFDFRPRFEVPVNVWEADARYARGRWEGRAEIATIAIANAGALNDAAAKTTGINPNIARTLRGGYLEMSYRVVSGASFGDVGAFGRYENVDTQFRMPAGHVPLKLFDRDVWVFGATYWPDPDVAVKFDYGRHRSGSAVVDNQHTFSAGLGWWF